MKEELRYWCPLCHNSNAMRYVELFAHLCDQHHVLKRTAFSLCHAIEVARLVEEHDDA